MRSWRWYKNAAEPHICTCRNVYRTPWAGDPRVNIQNDKGFAKAYQVKQVLGAIDKLTKEREK
jgi:hypothetical protein